MVLLGLQPHIPLHFINVALYVGPLIASSNWPAGLKTRGSVSEAEVKPDSAQGQVCWWEVRFSGDSGQRHCNPTHVWCSRWPHCRGQWPSLAWTSLLVHSFTHSLIHSFLDIKLFTIFLPNSVGGSWSYFLQSHFASYRSKASVRRTVCGLAPGWDSTATRTPEPTQGTE